MATRYEKLQGQLPLFEYPCWQLRLLHIWVSCVCCMLRRGPENLTCAKEKSSVMLVSMPCFCRTSHALMPSHVEAICSRHPTPLPSTRAITLGGQTRAIFSTLGAWSVQELVHTVQATAAVVQGY